VVTGYSASAGRADMASMSAVAASAKRPNLENLIERSPVLCKYIITPYGVSGKIAVDEG